MRTADLAQHAKGRGFHSEMRRLTHANSTEVLKELRYYLNHGIPLVACQKYTDDKPDVGHFRVVLGVDQDDVVFHDPCPKVGGPEMRWPLARFTEYWQATGEAVQGGYSILVNKQPIPSPRPLSEG